MGEPPLVLTYCEEEGPPVVPADKDGLEGNTTVLGVHHPDLRPEGER
jgi:hypothetical protein